MRFEYEAIAAAGATVQLDCPDLAMGRHTAYAGMDLAEFRRRAAMNIEALNHAVRNIPADQLRMHLCWGNYPGPHHHDVDLADIIDLVWTAKPRTVLFEAANPRHAHEWRLFEDVVVPGRQGPVPRGDRAAVQLHRAPRARGPADRALRAGPSAATGSWPASTAGSASTSACRASTPTSRGPSFARWPRARRWRRSARNCRGEPFVATPRLHERHAYSVSSAVREAASA